MQDNNNIEILKQFNLSEQEAQIYIALLKMGRSTVLNLSRYTGIKRSSVHHYTDQLISKGLIVQTSNEGRRLLIAEPPEKLKTLLRQRADELAQLDIKLPDILKALEGLIPKEGEMYDQSVLYYSGHKPIAELYNEILKNDELFTIVTIKKTEDAFPENHKKFADAIKNGMKLWSIVIGSELNVERLKVNQLHQVKYVEDKKYDVAIDLIVYKDHLAIITFNEIKPTAVIINNPTVSKSFEALYMLIWDMLPATKDE